ncbi:carbohydrate esterase family 8 protein [Punctularia strigosozonata HHB-11173 SS5]|uniref:Pectinesterase n=1 Tax=Punctularia strigosozonata (strain HHB-11173) TaxID=741275 RepID=R7S175_PUNST|nr:carbohydrate esterase family 8 protein [Punctularia strigosozonata HHB-11173 SS5]EIN03542.1 carbohydrate esterase family 8 protein [Punctularia strigosozonata HHB-11173 SS5]
MRNILDIVPILSFISLACALSSPPSGAITVGTGGKYAQLSDAMADTSSNVYFVFSGTYTDTVKITRSNIKVFGQTSTNLSYTGNTVTITNNIPASVAGSDEASGTVQVTGSSVSLYNLNIANTYGKPVDQAQAIALATYGTQFGGYGLKITGDQDTLLANVGLQYFKNCWIEGAVDFIFGQQSSIWISTSIINTIGSGAITASGRSSDDSNWYVIDHSTVQGTGTVFLGRPWRDYARVVFQNTALGSNVQPAGWEEWSTATPNTDHVTFAEYGNTGAGASGTRASFATKLSAPIATATVIGSSYKSWIDAAWL